MNPVGRENYFQIEVSRRKKEDQEGAQICGQI